MIRRPPRSTLSSSSAASDVYKRQGFDTLWWRLAEEREHPILWVEVDMPQVVSRKAGIISQNQRLSAGLLDCCIDDISVRSKEYCAVSADLREIGSLQQAVESAGIQFRVPTMVISECVLVYLDPQEAAAVLQWVADSFDSAGLGLYEQVNPGTRFGNMMVKNLEMRGCPLRGILSSIDSQAHRLLDLGWLHADAKDMNAVWRQISLEERQRVERLEHLDEFEEHEMMQGHYCIAWGSSNKPGAEAVGMDVFNLTDI
eukprot:TRINITY_DN32265_c0_g1_i2.p1 TRINITY_DN32265_c0_g1~~TRINITY_DN32265_c0_g1_i2.p1  ORF type:complete len:257 (+),score=79.50 TRINITY_DN32265_c0_g1_i2:112-882(+)